MRAATLSVPHVVRLTPPVPRKPAAAGWRSWRLWVIALDAILLAGALAIQKWPLLKIRRVEVEGPAIWESRARAQISLPADSNLFALDLDNLQSRLQAEFGDLAECRAQLLLPDKLLIQIAPTPLTLWTEGGMGVGVDGSLLVTPAVEQPAPIWRASLGSSGDARTRSTVHAAGAWSQVLRADGRFTSAVSEWGCDPQTGWTMVGADGQTRMRVGWSDLSRRSAYVSALLARPDTILAAPCAIDARFEGQLVVSSLAMLDDSASVGDTSKSVVPRPKVAAPARSEQSLGTVPSSVKAGPPSRPARPAKVAAIRPSKSTKSILQPHNSVGEKKTKPKNARRGGA